MIAWKQSNIVSDNPISFIIQGNRTISFNFGIMASKITTKWDIFRINCNNL